MGQEKLPESQDSPLVHVCRGVIFCLKLTRLHKYPLRKLQAAKLTSVCNLNTQQLAQRNFTELLQMTDQS